MDRFLNLTDDSFVVDVKEDLKYFISKQRPDSVLVFPPVSNYRRFLIHRSVEELGQPGLATFSIGVSDERRTVVCFKERLLSNEACAKPRAMGLTEFNEAPISNTGAVVGACKPALEQCAQPRQEKIRAKPRRPDREVYVPRALRTSNPPSNEPPTSPETRKRPSQSAEGHKTHTSPPPRDKSQPATPRKSIDKTFCNVYTPPHLRNHKSQPPNTPDIVPSVPNDDGDSAITSDNFYIGDYINGHFGIYPSYFSDYLHQNYSLDTNVTMAVPEHHSNLIDNNGYAYNKDEDVEKNELIRASQEINRSSKRIIKQTFDSDVLVISDPEPAEPKHREIEEEKKIEPETKRPKAKLEAKVSLKREENDWDAVFDDSGECLDPSLLEELTSTVGKVHISKTKNDYGPYQTKTQALFNGPYDETFGHVIEVYDFPSEFKTNDLLSVFSEYKDTGFEIKWVDDTHALICFSSAKIAAEVLSTQRPLVRCRPMHAATVESKTKAKKCAEFLQPYRQRPETCTALARRLVTGALGVKLSTASQERAEERRIITAAREKKRQAALHKEAAWEGSLANQTQTSTADS